jgi:rod shape determining protein RodA
MDLRGDSEFAGPRGARRMDWPMLCVTLLLCVIGLLTLYSAAGSPLQDGAPRAFKMQTLYMGLGFVGLLLVSLLDPRVYERVAYVFYGVVLLLLLAVLGIGAIRGGSQAWIPIGPVNLQPSELAKLAMVLACARFFAARSRDDGWGVRELLVPASLFLLPAASLVYLEPDLGTTLSLLLIFLGVCFVVGLRWRTLAVFVALGALLTPLAYEYVLDDYQRQRIDTLLAPDADPKGKGYQGIQGIYAIGSGQAFGKGWGQSTQGRLRFLPEQHTDFVFSVFAEEHGFAGSFVVLSLYFAQLLGGLWIAWNARDRFGSILAAGIVSILFCQEVVNLGGVLGMLPITGVTLPFMSYGGSSVLMTLAGIGMLISVSVRRNG